MVIPDINGYWDVPKSFRGAFLRVHIALFFSVLHHEKKPKRGKDRKRPSGKNAISSVHSKRGSLNEKRASRESYVARFLHGNRGLKNEAHIGPKGRQRSGKGKTGIPNIHCAACTLSFTRLETSSFPRQN